MSALAAATRTREPSIPWPPTGMVFDRHGAPVDVTGAEWTLRDPTAIVRLHWHRINAPDGNLLRSLQRHFVFLIGSQQPKSVQNAFRAILPFTATGAFRTALQDDAVVPYLAFSEAAARLGDKDRWRLHYARKMYRWCVAQGFPNFSRDVAARLDDVVIGGNAKGQAVRSRDPDQGPLDAQEVAALTIALRAVRAEGTMPLEEQAAVWLALSTGSNAGQYACMREEDVIEETLAGSTVAWIVAVPRHKKGDVHPRAAFRHRKVHRFVGMILRDLVAQNRKSFPTVDDDTDARPLFRRNAPRDTGDEWSSHMLREEFTELLQRAVKRLRVRSRSGGALRISTRRFRYSLATRLVNAGASMLAVADALDHSDMQNVSVYFDVHSDIVEHLDRAMALALAPRAQAFTRIIESEADAERGDVKSSRRYHGDRDRNVFEPIGTCGSHSFCNVHAPLACYTCHRFQPWMDGPHDLVLDSLLEARDRRIDQGLDPKLVTIEDEVIAAVASVIVRIAAKRQESVDAG